MDVLRADWFLTSTLCFFIPLNLAVAQEVDLPSSAIPTAAIASFRELATIQLDGLIEGLSTGADVVLENRLGKDVNFLMSFASCGCLKTKGIDGETWINGDSLKVRFAILPTAGSFDQTCTISGIVDGESDRRDVCKITLRGKVIKPVSLSRSAVMPSDWESGKMTVDVTSVPQVKMDLAQISLTEAIPGVSVAGDAEHSQVHFSFAKGVAFDSKKKDIYEGGVSLAVPLKWNGQSFKYLIPLKIVDELLSVTPSVLVFRDYVRDEGETTFCRGKMNLYANGLALDPTELTVSLTNKQGEITKYRQGSPGMKVRSINENTVQFEFDLPEKELVDSKRELLISVGKVASKVIRFTLFQE